jgi:hypothetical protein
MATVADRPATRTARPPAPPARHGRCSLTLSIGGVPYRLHPITPPPGYRVVWSLRKQSETESPVYQVSLVKGGSPACTCPDFTVRGAICKHIGSLKALGLIPGRRPRPAAARRSLARRLQEPADPPAPPAGPTARGVIASAFGRAVHAEIRRKAAIIDGRPIDPEDEPSTWECSACGSEFDPDQSRDPHLCPACAEEYNQ